MTTRSMPAAAGTTGLWLLRTVAVAAAVELVVLRTMTRTAIHIPGIARVEGPYRVVAETGRFAYSAAVLLVAVALGWMAWKEWERRRLTVSLAAVVWFLAAAAAARLGLISDSVLDLSVIGGVLLLATAAIGKYRARALPVLLFAMSFAAAGLHGAGPAAGLGSGVVLSAPDGLLPLAEALAIVACLASPMLVSGRLRRAPLVAAAVVALATLLALLASPATVKILLLWNFGLAGYFPALVYAGAFGTLAFTALTSRMPDPYLAVGLALLVLGGISLHSSYQSGLVVLGLLAVARSGPDPGTAFVRHPARTAVRVSLPASAG